MSRLLPRFIAIVLGALIALGTGISPAVSQAVQVGIAASLTGDVTLSNARITKPRKLAPRERLAWGDRVSTRKASQLQILLLDRSSLTLGANSTLTIDRFVYNPNQPRSISATAGKGAFRFMSGRRDRTSSGQINGPAGSIGIRGTALDFVIGKDAVGIARKEAGLGKLRHDPETAMLVLLRGPGAATAGDLTPGLADVTGAGKTVTLDAPSLAAYIPRQGAEPVGPFRISPAGMGQMQSRLAPNVARANRSSSFKRLLPALGAAAAIGIGAAILSSGGNDGQDQGPTGNSNNPCPPGTPTGASPNC
jgi:hypothetical protein